MDLLKKFDFELSDGPIQGEEKILSILERTIFYSTHQSHPFYVYHPIAAG